MKPSQPLILSLISTVAVALIRDGCQYAQKQESVRKFQKWRCLSSPCPIETPALEVFRWDEKPMPPKNLVATDSRTVYKEG